jgi:hypothetical protein
MRWYDLERNLSKHKHHFAMKEHIGLIIALLLSAICLARMFWPDNRRDTEDRLWWIYPLLPIWMIYFGGWLGVIFVLIVGIFILLWGGALPDKPETWICLFGSVISFFISTISFAYLPFFSILMFQMGVLLIISPYVYLFWLLMSHIFENIRRKQKTTQ